MMMLFAYEWSRYDRIIALMLETLKGKGSGIRLGFDHELKKRLQSGTLYADSDYSEIQMPRLITYLSKHTEEELKCLMHILKAEGLCCLVDDLHFEYLKHRNLAKLFAESLWFECIRYMEFYDLHGSYVDRVTTATQTLTRA